MYKLTISQDYSKIERLCRTLDDALNLIREVENNQVCGEPCWYKIEEENDV